MLTREQILAAEDLKFEEVNVPEWGGKVRIKCMTGAERDAFEADIYDVTGKDVQINRNNFRAKLLARTIVDEKGKRLFSDGDIKALGEKSAKALDIVFEAAQRLNALTKADQDELTKN